MEIIEVLLSYMFSPLGIIVGLITAGIVTFIERGKMKVVNVARSAGNYATSNIALTHSRDIFVGRDVQRRRIEKPGR